MSGMLMKGNLQLSLLSSAFLLEGYGETVNGTSVAIETQDPDEKSRVGTGEDTYGQSLDTVLITKPQKITVTFDEQAPESLALGLGGTVAAYSQGAVTDEAISIVAHLDKWMPVGYRNIDAGGLNHATWVEDTDYTVDHVRGQVKFLSTGSATEDEDVSMTVTASAVAASRITGATRSTFYANILLSGINQADGKRGTLEVLRASLAPSGSIDPMTGEFTVTSLKGTLVTPPGASGPYTWDTEEVHS